MAEHVLDSSRSLSQVSVFFDRATRILVNYFLPQREYVSQTVTKSGNGEDDSHHLLLEYEIDCWQFSKDEEIGLGRVGDEGKMDEEVLKKKGWWRKLRLVVER